MSDIRQNGDEKELRKDDDLSRTLITDEYLGADYVTEDENVDDIMTEAEDSDADNAELDEDSILRRLAPKKTVTGGKRKRKRHWYGVPVGTVVLCLAAVGLFFIGSQIYNFAYKIITDDSEERAYDSFISTVVMMDPAPFENIAAADNKLVLRTAIWQTVFNNISDNQNFDEYARIIIPEDQVSSMAMHLFGVNCNIVPTNIDVSNLGLSESEWIPETTIEYDELKAEYHVPLLATVGTYQPYTVSIKNTGNSKLLKVAYCIVPENSSNVPGDAETVGDGLLVVKYMEYEISYDSDLQKEYISAIRNVE